MKTKFTRLFISFIVITYGLIGTLDIAVAANTTDTQALKQVSKAPVLRYSSWKCFGGKIQCQTVRGITGPTQICKCVTLF